MNPSRDRAPLLAYCTLVTRAYAHVTRAGTFLLPQVDQFGALTVPVAVDALDTDSEIARCLIACHDSTLTASELQRRLADRSDTLAHDTGDDQVARKQVLDAFLMAARTLDRAPAPAPRAGARRLGSLSSWQQRSGLRDTARRLAHDPSA